MAGKNQRSKTHIIEEQFDEISYLKEIVQNLEKTTRDIKNLLTKIIIELTGKPKKKIKTKKFDKKKTIEVSRDSTELKCKMCDIKFVKLCELESHIETSHETYHKFECQICKKTFVTKWRLKKHKNLHSGKVKTDKQTFTLKPMLDNLGPQYELLLDLTL